jgi:hypothetical protein
MPTPIENLQESERINERLLNLLTDVDQSLEQVHALLQQYCSNHDPRGLLNMIQEIQGDISRTAQRHNQLVGQLREARAEEDARAARGEPAETP